MALYSRITVWVSNQVLTAAALNAEFNNILNNAMASSLIGFSANVSQMQQQTNPGGVGTESLAGSTSDELQRLRFMLAYTLGTMYWYDQTGRNLGAGNLAVQTADIVNGAVTPAKLASGFNALPTGSILPFAGSSSPSGFLFCDGSSYLRATYPTLFSVIGTTWGSLDGTHFNVPDLRGQFLRGDTSGITGGTISAVSGNSLTVTGHNLNRTGVAIRLTGSLPTGLSTGTTYYAIVIDANTLQVATTLANALADVPITLSSTTTGGAVVQWVDPDASSRTQQAVGGASSGAGTLEGYQVQAHTHSIDVGTNYAGAAWAAASNSGPNYTFETHALGGNETRPTNVSVQFIIAT